MLKFDLRVKLGRVTSGAKIAVNAFKGWRQTVLVIPWVGGCWKYKPMVVCMDNVDFFSVDTREYVLTHFLINRSRFNPRLRYAWLTGHELRLGYARTSIGIDAAAEVTILNYELWKSWSHELTSGFSHVCQYQHIMACWLVLSRPKLWNNIFFFFFFGGGGGGDGEKWEHFKDSPINCTSEK